MRPRRLLPWLALLIAAASLVLAERRSGGDEAPRASAVVTRVVDGDTVAVRLGGQQEKVRYIGIDTPESVKPGTPVQCFGKAAADQNRLLVANRRVTLRYDAERRDRYGRLLAYVYRRDDGLFVNAELVGRGFARTLTIPPNVGHAEQLARLARRARQRKRGLWLACPS